MPHMSMSPRLEALKLLAKAVNLGILAVNLELGRLVQTRDIALECQALRRQDGSSLLKGLLLLLQQCFVCLRCLGTRAQRSLWLSLQVSFATLPPSFTRPAHPSRAAPAQEAPGQLRRGPHRGRQRYPRGHSCHRRFVQCCTNQPLR
eukprot:m.43103 g.43103  ORF g.43103 m.43103 type:complete len:147 (-) comp6134_c0_seq2:90-530(-)